MGDMRMVVGLGNPGPEYDATRHNVGWWVVDRLAYDWGFGGFSRMGRSLVAEGSVGQDRVRLMKPTTYMNRAGLALAEVRADPAFDAEDDLLVVVDDATLDVGRVRFRPAGGHGGHNGLRSVAGALGTQAYARLRVGVGRGPDTVDLADWVLSPMPDADEEIVLQLLPRLTGAVELWIAEGIEAAMNRFNG